MGSTSTPKLFTPATVGRLNLKHRVVLAPLTRFRAEEKTHVPTPLMREYYTQRASTPGTLLITEATFIAARAGGYPHAPGIWSEEQVKGWKEVTDGVHAAGSFIYLQLWSIGRAANPEVLASEGFPFVSSSHIPLKGTTAIPRPLTIDEIKEYIGLYREAAKNAIRAGFDGVEVHCANGYLLDQFIQDVSNKRTDEYGGSVENRCRFPLAVIDAVVNEVGADRTGVRLGPWTEFQDMRMADPIPTFTHMTQQILAHHPEFSYIHVIEPRANGDKVVDPDSKNIAYSNDFIRAIWSPPGSGRVLISAGGYTRATALVRAEEKERELIGFGRSFLATPDLPLRLQRDVPPNEADRKTFYKAGSKDGYTDYPFAEAAGLKARV